MDTQTKDGRYLFQSEIYVPVCRDNFYKGHPSQGESPISYYLSLRDINRLLDSHRWNYREDQFTLYRRKKVHECRLIFQP